MAGRAGRFDAREEEPMRATCIEWSPTRAVIELRPRWLARAFGARTTLLELEWSDGQWRTLGTRRSLDRLSYREYPEEIRHALDFRPKLELPSATLHKVPL
jgi:hypothetical protein